MTCQGFNRPSCGRPSRRPNGLSEGAQYCVNCHSRYLYNKHKADPDFVIWHAARCLREYHHNNGNVKRRVLTAQRAAHA